MKIFALGLADHVWIVFFACRAQINLCVCLHHFCSICLKTVATTSKWIGLKLIQVCYHFISSQPSSASLALEVISPPSKRATGQGSLCECECFDKQGDGTTGRDGLWHGQLVFDHFEVLHANESVVVHANTRTHTPVGLKAKVRKKTKAQVAWKEHFPTLPLIKLSHGPMSDCVAQLSLFFVIVVFFVVVVVVIPSQRFLSHLHFYYLNKLQTNFVCQ